MSSKKSQLTQELNEQFRYASGNFVMFSQAIADKVGIHSTDNECIDLLLLNGALTAGKLAELTGLTTGSVTAMIDRLEKTGYVKRTADKNDRRKILVVPNKEKILKEIAPLTKSMGLEFEKLSKQFSEEGLKTILSFMTKANEIATKEISKLRTK